MSVTAVEEYDRAWDMWIDAHKQIHGEDHVPVKDFNCCGEYAVVMALRAMSTLKADYPAYLVKRMSAMPDLDKEFYVKHLLSTDGEPEPSDPEPLREYRASRRYHILWSELKEAAARIEDLERQLEESRMRNAELEERFRKAGPEAEASAGKA
ncbi:MAG TPA: hypothetical protein VJ224_02215 [Thermoplasmata archaeon]|nr:hypothetical protein [Thermoplasmata archaeon]